MHLVLSKYPPRLSVAAIALTLSLGLLPSCTASTSVDASESSDTPRFTGNYADEYRQAWQHTDVDFIHDALRDEKITEQEWSEVLERFGDCFQDHGMKLLEYDDGEYGVDSLGASEDRTNDIMSKCEEQSGEAVIGRLRRSERINPNNRDIDEIMHECLIRLGAVDPSYTLEAYLRDAPDFAFPFLTDNGSELYDNCARDPLSAVSDK